MSKQNKSAKDAEKGCHALSVKVDEILGKRRESKFNSLESCDSDHAACNCGGPSDGNPKGQMTDLIVLIDTSGSMGSSANAVSDAVANALERAKEQCEPDLRLIFLGVDGVWASTLFTQSHRDYITGLHGPGVVLKGDLNHVGYLKEQGANAIEDLSKYADWRDGACRAIFYISDEELDSYSPIGDYANETTTTTAAITEANANNVTVFAHHLTYQNRGPQIIQNYKDLCYNTGGDVYFSNAPDEKEYEMLITDVICNSCGKSVCKELDLELKPCISIKWGDSDCDCLESSDYEVMTITVCNCYSNLTFKNYTISMLEITDADGKPVATLPNGNPSVALHPTGVYCFGDIGPCACVTREFVLITEGAKEGKYKLNVKGICYNVSIQNEDNSECFSLEICKD